MRFLSELWVPILVSAAACFVWYALAWMALPHHKREWKRLPAEPEVLDALRKGATPAGLYSFPFTIGEDLNRPDVKAALERGPSGHLVIRGRTSMGLAMAQSLGLYVVVSTLTAYVAWNAGLGLGARQSAVFRMVETVSMMAYVTAMVPESIWFGRPWTSWFYTLLDGVVAALLTAGAFAWLWPK